MFVSEVSLRVRYGETDRMGYVYYGNYAGYYEVGRVEALRALGWNYKEMEDSGILLPVHSFSIKYHKPAYYDDLLVVKTMIKEIPKARIRFDYEMYNAKGELINEGETTLVFIKADTKRPCGSPADFVKAIAPYFTQQNS
ncbi:MAG: acyl-CoA thioester hydrolase [Bacteroidetes bacterium]|nr:MAG: acyl-CoA thioester hydrolase [Bacteroidota bacterium]